jgi:hypothetical protein
MIVMLCVMSNAWAMESYDTANDQGSPRKRSREERNESSRSLERIPRLINRYDVQELMQLLYDHLVNNDTHKAVELCYDIIDDAGLTETECNDARDSLAQYLQSKK